MIYLGHIRSVINFEFLSLPKFYELFLKDRADFLKFWEEDPNLGATNLVVSLSNYFIGAAIAVVALGLFLVGARCFSRIRTEVLQKVKDLKDKMVFNGVVRSLTLGWV